MIQSFRNKEPNNGYKEGKRWSFDLEELECWESRSRDKRPTLHSCPTSSATGAHDWLASWLPYQEKRPAPGKPPYITHHDCLGANTVPPGVLSTAALSERQTMAT